MPIARDIPTLPSKYTAGDLEEPVEVRWNVVLTTETSEIIIDRPEPSVTITIPGVLLDASTGLFEYPWSVGDLVAGEGQLVKARLFDTGGRRRSTEFFKIDVEEDPT